MSAAKFGGVHDTVHGKPGSVSTILSRTDRLKKVLLQHHTDLTPQPGRVDLREINAVHQNPATLWHIEALHHLAMVLSQILSAPTTPTICPWLQSKRNTLQHGRPIDTIPERHIVKYNLPGNLRKSRAVGIARTVLAWH